MNENQTNNPAAEGKQAPEITLEHVQAFVTENEDAKKWLSSEKDKFFSKSLESWKMKNLESLIEAEVAKRNPAKTTAEIKLEELQRKFEAMEKANQRAAIEKYAIKEANELQLPIELANFCLADTEEDTLSNLTTFKKAIDDLVQQQVDQRLKGSGRTVQTTKTGVATPAQPQTTQSLFASYLQNQK